jgi:hypothetical protein
MPIMTRPIMSLKFIVGSRITIIINPTWIDQKSSRHSGSPPAAILAFDSAAALVKTCGWVTRGTVISQTALALMASNLLGQCARFSLSLPQDAFRNATLLCQTHSTPIAQAPTLMMNRRPLYPFHTAVPGKHRGKARKASVMALGWHRQQCQSDTKLSHSSTGAAV